MRKYQKWMVVVDDVIAQTPYLKNISKLADQFIPIEIKFIIPAGKVNLPKELLKDLPFELSQAEELNNQSRNIDIIKKIVHSDHHFDVQFEYENWLTAVLNGSSKFEPDLLIVSKSNKGRIVLNTQKLVRKAPCSTLLLANHSFEMNKIAAHLDLSNYSELVVAFLKEVQEFSPFMNFELIHTYEGASQYMHKIYERADEAIEAVVKESKVDSLLMESAKMKFTEYCKKKGIQSAKKKYLSYGDAEIKARKVGKAISQSQADLVVLGSKGTDTSKVDLLSPLTDGLMQSEVLTNVLILKEKGENKGLLKALLKLLN